MSKNQQYKKRTGTLYRRWKGKDYSIDDPIAINNGTVWLKYDLHGKTTRKSLKTTNLKEAEQKRDSIMLPLQVADEAEASAQLVLKADQAQQKLDTVLLSQNPPLSIEEAWDTYLGSHERPDSGERTLLDYESHWKQFAKWILAKHSESTTIRAITPTIASEYASHLTKEKLSPNTFNKRINFLKLICTVLATPAQIETNPFEKIKSRKLKTTSKRELTQHELKTVLNTADGNLKILFYIGTFTGLRLGDCATLKWGEVDMDKLLIRRVPNKTRSRTPKPMTIGIPRPLFELLNIAPINKRKGFVLPDFAKEYQRDISTLCKITQKHFTDCDIQTHKEGTGKTEQYEAALKAWVKGKKKGKKPTYTRAIVEVGFHSLRHTFVSLHATLGTPQAVIMAIVGHGNPAMTHHYTHIGEDTARKAAGVLPDPTVTKKEEVPDAEFEVIDEEIVPDWILDKLKSQTARNWKKVRDELVGKS
ncbi:MAG: tyrosine-type recombinase/integrase [Verrucomicrobiota bacterium]